MQYRVTVVHVSRRFIVYCIYRKRVPRYHTSGFTTSRNWNANQSKTTASETKSEGTTQAARTSNRRRCNAGPQQVFQLQDQEVDDPARNQKYRLPSQSIRHRSDESSRAPTRRPRTTACRSTRRGAQYTSPSSNLKHKNNKTQKTNTTQIHQTSAKCQRLLYYTIGTAHYCIT